MRTPISESDAYSAASLVVSAALCLSSMWCFCGKRTSSNPGGLYRDSLRAWRLVVYALLATSQAALVSLGLHNLGHEHSVLVSLDQWCALVLWAGITVMLIWPHRGSLQLFPSHLTSLLRVTVLLTMDIKALHGEHSMDIDTSTCISVRTSQLALVLMLLIVDFTALHGVVATAADNDSIGRPLRSRNKSDMLNMAESDLPLQGMTRMPMALTAVLYICPVKGLAGHWFCLVLVLLDCLVDLCHPIFYEDMLDRMTTISMGHPLADMARSYWYALYPLLISYLAFYFLRRVAGSLPPLWQRHTRLHRDGATPAASSTPPPAAVPAALPSVALPAAQPEMQMSAAPSDPLSGGQVEVQAHVEELADVSSQAQQQPLVTPTVEHHVPGKNVRIVADWLK